ncbi:MAG: hypothetical protein LBK66_00585 [Spirochaetaceae bacterium]|jgi:hypothetical protein|nr:hypothetical protein [Spirochaetaceae bacterium]
MRNIVLILFCAGLCGSLFAQSPSSTGVTGTWKHEKTGLTFQFNADGTFTMGEEDEAARKAIEQEQRRRGERVITSVSGTYTVTGNRIEMLMLVDGKTHKARMTWRLIDANTLRLNNQNYRLIVDIN